MKLLSSDNLIPGTESRIIYREGRHEYTIIEHVTERRESVFITPRSETASGTPVSVNRFKSLCAGTSRWPLYVNHSFLSLTRLGGLFLRTARLRRIDGRMQRFELIVEPDAREVER